ncbi:MAG: hypothetical protein HQM09_10740 [Candidatus Riflebacteria bacterium]|nr:hypothetical protein [Candidatus Riflebacteria bacterium]
MAFRILALVFVVLTIMLIPAAITGCGVDNSEQNSHVSLTVGPGNYGPDQLTNPENLARHLASQTPSGSRLSD